MKRWQKITCLGLALLVGAGMMDHTLAAAAQKDYQTALPSDYEGTLSMWGWDDAYFQAVTEAFCEKYPNVTFKYTPMANGDTLQKYQTAVAAGTELPDVAWAIIDSRAKVFELDMWEDLSAAPYNFDINDCFDYLHEKMINSRGMVCGIEQCISPAGLAYRKDLAKEWLGTDDPEELEEMFPTWEAFIEKGQEVYEKSGGEVYMLRAVSEAQEFIREQSGISWITDDVINVKAALERSIDLAVQIRDKNVCDSLEAWSPAWNQSFGEDRHIFAGCATWSIMYTIAANDSEGEQTGHWGLMNAPEGNVSWGGTTLGITKNCRDKRLAWEFIKFATLSTEGAQVLDSIGFMTSAKAPYEENPELRNMTSPWFGEQNLGEIFLDEIVPNIQTRMMNYDDIVIHETLNLVTASINTDKEMTAEEAMGFLTEELKIRLPGYTVK